MNEVVKRRIEQIKRGEVPAGYKKTTVGIVPEEWEIHSLSRHLTQSCIPGTNGSVARKLTVKLWNKGVYAKREIHEGSESTTYYKRKSGQLIYSKLDFLNCAFGIIPEELDGFESTQDLPCFDIHGVNKYFLLSYITRRSFYTHFGMIADGGRKARRVGPEDMLSFPLLYPPLAEQEKIAEILTTQDKVIALKEKLLEEKKKQKKYLMQQLLTGKMRLPVFEGKWKTIFLKDISIKQKAKNDGFRYKTVFSNSAQRGIVLQEEQFDKDIANVESIDRYYIVLPGMFVYNPRISVTAPCGPINVNETNITGVMSPLYTVFSVDNPAVNNLFLKFYFQSTIWFRYMTGVANYGARHDRMSITDEDFFGMDISFPPLDEQTAIANALDNADKEISIIQKLIDQEKQKKKALMQLLLTGIVRV